MKLVELGRLGEASLEMMKLGELWNVEIRYSELGIMKLGKLGELWIDKVE